MKKSTSIKWKNVCSLLQIVMLNDSGHLGEDAGILLDIFSQYHAFNLQVFGNGGHPREDARVSSRDSVGLVKWGDERRFSRRLRAHPRHLHALHTSLSGTHLSISFASGRVHIFLKEKLEDDEIQTNSDAFFIRRYIPKQRFQLYSEFFDLAKMTSSDLSGWPSVRPSVRLKKYPSIRTKPW